MHTCSFHFWVLQNICRWGIELCHMTAVLHNSCITWESHHLTTTSHDSLCKIRSPWNPTSWRLASRMPCIQNALHVGHFASHLGLLTFRTPCIQDTLHPGHLAFRTPCIQDILHSGHLAFRAPPCIQDTSFIPILTIRSRMCTVVWTAKCVLELCSIIISPLNNGALLLGDDCWACTLWNWCTCILTSNVPCTKGGERPGEKDRTDYHKFTLPSPHTPTLTSTHLDNISTHPYPGTKIESTHYASSMLQTAFPKILATANINPYTEADPPQSEQATLHAAS
jgi:hypothetical protein